MTMLFGSAHSLSAVSLEELWKAATRDGSYRAASSEELQHVTALFVRTLIEQGTGDELQREWAEMGMEIVLLHAQETLLWVIREQSFRKTGRGFYVVRLGQAQALAIQAPHSGADRYTGEIALRLMQEGNAKAGAWRTATRAQADLAHLDQTYFQAFTQAFAQVFPSGQILQLHGFEQEKREGRSAGDADIVLSNGTSTPPAHLTQVANCLTGELHVSVKRYPYEAKDLGATTNAQALLLQRLGYAGFLHVEMSEQTREQLQRNQERRVAFLHCVVTE